MYKEQFPEFVRERLAQLKERRAGFTTPGPNYMWCVDGYMKLAMYGFEIYAAIDAYARYVVWFFVGVGSVTARSVFAQYVDVVETHGYLPMVIRSDRGGETTIAATAHYALSRGTQSYRMAKPSRNEDEEVVFTRQESADDPQTRVTIPLESLNEDLPLWEPERELLLRDCWCFGKSTQNQRIESFWRQVARGRASFWRVSLFPLSLIQSKY